MNSVIMLFAKQSEVLSPDHLDKIRSYLQEKNIEITTPDIIDDGKSISTFCNLNQNIIELQKELTEIFFPLKTDIIILNKSELKTKKLLIADMDSTLIQQECIDELAEYTGKKEEVAEITAKAMRGELDFVESLINRVKALKGLPLEELQECFDKKIKLTSGAKELVKYMNDNDAKTLLVSGGFTFFAKQVARKLSIDKYYANELIIKDNKLLGTLHPPIINAERKKEILDDLIKDHNLDKDEIIAIGDGANDIPMLKTAGLSIAFRAKPVVKESTRISINFADLNAVKYIQMVCK